MYWESLHALLVYPFPFCTSIGACACAFFPIGLLGICTTIAFILIILLYLGNFSLCVRVCTFFNVKIDIRVSEAVSILNFKSNRSRCKFKFYNMTFVAGAGWLCANNLWYACVFMHNAA